jgi:hypothetical protein
VNSRYPRPGIGFPFWYGLYCCVGRSATPDHDAKTTRPSESRRSDDLLRAWRLASRLSQGGQYKNPISLDRRAGWWLEENEGRLEDEVRVRRIKRWRAEALEQLRLELDRTHP